MRYILYLVSIILLSTMSYGKWVNAINTNHKPEIDGIIDDIWSDGLRFDQFVQKQPDILAESTVKTEVYFLYDSEHVYIAARLFQNSSTIHSNRGKKDTDVIIQGDYFLVIIDPLNNGNMAYFFTINPNNGIRDGILLDDDGTITLAWDANFESAAKIYNNYWCVELKVPLNTITFQEKDVQEWGIHFGRSYAQNREIMMNQIIDIHKPLRISNFFKIKGLKGLKTNRKFKLSPYFYSKRESNFLKEHSYLSGKIGMDLKYNPINYLTILGTINPDYAQIETDKEIINVSDLPTEFPEKRPFFIESSEFYPGAAVNTRNIVDIKTGLKLKKLGGLFNYDVTGVLDGQNNQWLLSNYRITDGSTYLAELVGGLKNHKDSFDYNMTTHVVKWFFDKRLRIYNWTGTINSRISNKNEWETVNSIKWQTRTVYSGFWSHFKTKFYNPNIVGWNYLSNEVIFHIWFNYSFINTSDFLRNTTLELHANQYDLFSNGGNYYYVHYITLNNELHISPSLGIWKIAVNYSPASGQKFRYRKVTYFDKKRIFKDTISEFVLIDDPASHWQIEIETDRSRKIGTSLIFSNEHVRGSKSINLTSEVWLKIGSNSILSYDLAYVDIAGSSYQEQFEQIIHRLKAEYNFTDKLNLRLIFQPITIRRPKENNYKYLNATINAVLSWEYDQGSYLYFVFNKAHYAEESTIIPKYTLLNDQILAFKINKSFSF